MLVITEHELLTIKDTLRACREELDFCAESGNDGGTGAYEMIYDSMDIVDGLLREARHYREENDFVSDE